jgi:hypothetical protein
VRAKCECRLGRSLALPTRPRWARVSDPALDATGGLPGSDRASPAPALGAGLMTPHSMRPEACPARTEPRPPDAPALGAGL